MSKYDYLRLASKMVRCLAIFLFAIAPWTSLLQTDMKPPIPPASHLCTHILKGHFDSIRILSFSYSGPNLTLHHYPGHTYFMDDVRNGSLQPFSVTLPDHYLDWTEISDLAPVVAFNFKKKRRHATIRAVYTFTSDSGLNCTANSATWCQDQNLTILLACFDPFESVLLTEPSGHVKKVFADDGGWYHHIEYAILQSPADSSIGNHYVITRDTWDQTQYFTIMDFTFTSWLKPNIHCASWSNASFYYLEKTQNPDEVLLVHRSSRSGQPSPQVDSQLVYSLPKGFVRPGGPNGTTHTYLFDSDLACVYVLVDLPRNLTERFLASQENILLKRFNIPYEQYFRCKDSLVEDFYTRHDSNRCDTKIEG